MINYYRISNIEITSKSKKKLLLWKYCILYDKWVCMMDMFVDTWEQRKFSECTWNAGKRNKEDLDLEPYAITNEHGFIKQNTPEKVQ